MSLGKHCLIKHHNSGMLLTVSGEQVVVALPRIGTNESTHSNSQLWIINQSTIQSAEDQRYLTLDDSGTSDGLKCYS